MSLKFHIRLAARPHCFWLIAGALGLAPALAQPADARSGASRVTHVKVYPGSATVERVLRVAPGARQAVFACLPAGLDAASLQVRGDAGVRVGDLSTRQQPRELLGDACASPLQDRIRALEDQIAALQAESAGIGYAAGYLKSFENAPSGDGRATPPAQIGATVTALRQNAQTALTRQHQIQRQQEVLERTLKPLIAERDRAGGQQARVSTVQVTLAAPQGGELRLSYQVRGPSWQPSYRAMLDSATKQVRLERQALVAQNTGEDWDGVQLTLSTGQPGAATQGPLPRPWRVDIASPVQKDVALLEMAPAAAPMAMARARAVADSSEEVPSFDVSVFDGSFATEFAVPQRISVPSSGERVTLRLGEHVADTRLKTRATPAQDASAYLIADIAPPPGVWPAGPIGLYRDGAYVGNGRFDPATLARHGLAFGRDELVNVRMEQPQRQDGTGGFIGNRNERRVSRLYTVENRRRDTITLQVLDAAPVPEHADVRVESRYQPEPQTKTWSDQRGTVLWEQALAAGATQRFSAEHTITWPKDARLQERR